MPWPLQRLPSGVERTRAQDKEEAIPVATPLHGKTFKRHGFCFSLPHHLTASLLLSLPTSLPALACYNSARVAHARHRSSCRRSSSRSRLPGPCPPRRPHYPNAFYALPPRRDPPPPPSHCSPPHPHFPHPRH